MLIFWMLLLTIVESIPRLFKMVKNPPAMQEIGSLPWSGRSPWRRAWKLSPVYLPGESHGQRSLVGYSLCGCTELDITNFHFLS